VNSGDDCVLQTYGFRDNALVMLEEEALRLQNVQCGKGLAADRPGRLLVATTPSTAATIGALVHIVDVDLWSHVATLSSTASVAANAVSSLGVDAVLIASDDSTLIFDHDGHELLQLGMSGAKGTSALVLGRDKRRVAVGADDGTIRFFDNLPVSKITTSEFVYRIQKGSVACLTSDENSGGFGYGGLLLKDCEGGNTQLWDDPGYGELRNVALGQCLAGFDQGGSVFLAFANEIYGCQQGISLHDGFWYSSSYAGGSSWGCMGSQVFQDGQWQWLIQPCGNSLEECQASSMCPAGWHKGLEFVSV